MRLWTLHPMYLDPMGLVAVWREALLGQAVLLRRTEAYAWHPQLVRFNAQPDPIGAITTYLWYVHDEATRRGYHFDRSRICGRMEATPIHETRGQLLWEWSHLKTKLRRRSPVFYHAAGEIAIPRAHPLFRIVRGGIRSWERGAG